MKKIIAIMLAMVLITGCSNVGKNSNSNESNYPSKPVEVVVGFGAGGETDTVARLVFQFASKYFGQSFVIINKPGASGELAWAEVAKAKPDGYTIAFINPPTFVTHPVQRPDATYKIDDYKLIGNMVKDPACFIVKDDSEIKTFKDLAEKAKKENLSIGYSGPGTSEALTLRQLEEEYDVTFDKIPYDGSASSVVALLGNQIDACILNVSGAINYTNDNSVKVVGVVASDRSKEYPEITTLIEQGYDLVNEAYRGVAAPKDVPDEIISKIDDAIQKALEDPEFIKRAEEMKVPIYYLNSKDFTEVINKIKDELTTELEKGEW